MKTVAIIQARMGSTRLPGKVLTALDDKPAIAWVVRAARETIGIDEVWVATSTAPTDDPIAAWCISNGVPVHRGSEEDVLDRYAGAMKASAAEVVVRITGDCPLLDPSVVAQTIRLHASTGVAYVSNADPPTWPDGLDCEVMTTEALATAAREATRASDREHVTPFIRNNRARFTTETLISPLPGLTAERWTLDTADDLTFLRAVTARLPSVGRAPSHLEVLSVLDHEPQLRKINRNEFRNAGYAISVMREHVDTNRRLNRSQHLLARAKEIFPFEARAFHKSVVESPPSAASLFATYGDGGRIFDVDGNDYVDLMSTLKPNVLGYRDPDVDLAIRRQLTRGIGFSLATADQTSLAERLMKHIPCAEAVQFVRSGSDARLAAVRLARDVTRRDRIMEYGYGSWQEWSIATPPGNPDVPASISALSHTVSYGDLPAAAELFKQHPDEFAGIILDLSGAPEPHHSNLQGLIELAHHHGALVIFDELVTGFRWSLGGAQGRYAITPDLACFGETMGNGMPISAVVGRADVMRLMQDNHFFSGTFGGESLATAAAIATLDKMEREDVVGRLWHLGGELMRALGDKITAAGLDHVVKIVGSPPSAMLAYGAHARASNKAIKALLLGELLAAGVLINDRHNFCFAHSSIDIARVLAAYDHALAVLRGALDRGDIDHHLEKQVIRSLFTERAAS